DPARYLPQYPRLAGSCSRSTRRPRGRAPARLTTAILNVLSTTGTLDLPIMGMSISPVVHPNKRVQNERQCFTKPVDSRRSRRSTALRRTDALVLNYAAARSGHAV